MQGFKDILQNLLITRQRTGDRNEMLQPQTVSDIYSREEKLVKRPA